MINNKNYRITKFFEVADKSCAGKGYVKIDLRGNRGIITVNVENLSDGRMPSEVFLFKNRDEKIKIGQINTKHGRLQRSLLLNGKDEPLENYNICGIVLNDKIVMYTPVFTPPQITQLNVLLSKTEDVVGEKIMQGEEELQDDLSDTVVEANTSDDIEAIPEEDISSSYEVEKETVDEDLNSHDDSDETLSSDAEESVPEEAKLASGSFRKYNNEYERKLYSLLNEFEEIKPLAHDIRSMSWWKINYDENGVHKGFLPYFNQIISTYYPYPLSNHVTTCRTLMKKYGYYLFGIYEQNDKISKYIYGMPGKFTRDDQPYRGVTGFKNWSYKRNDIPGDYGYWIAFIDANTGSVSDAPNIE